MFVQRRIFGHLTHKEMSLLVSPLSKHLLKAQKIPQLFICGGILITWGTVLPLLGGYYYPVCALCLTIPSCTKRGPDFSVLNIL